MKRYYGLSLKLKHQNWWLLHLKPNSDFFYVFVLHGYVAHGNFIRPFSEPPHVIYFGRWGVTSPVNLELEGKPSWSSYTYSLWTIILLILFTGGWVQLSGLLVLSKSPLYKCATVFPKRDSFPPVSCFYPNIISCHLLQDHCQWMQKLEQPQVGRVAFCWVCATFYGERNFRWSPATGYY